MKKKLFTLLFSLLLLPAIMLAQAPEGFNFQAVIRNELGALAANQVVTMRISIVTDASGNNVIYSENHSVRSNSQGLVTLVVGRGSNATSSFSDINWSDGNLFVKVEADINGGFDYKLVSISQILSVPYALSARSAESVTGNVSYNQLTDVPVVEGFSGNYDDLSGKPELFSGDYNDLSNLPNLFSGRYADLTGKPSIADSVNKYTFSGSYNDLTDKPTLFSGSYNDLTDVPPMHAGFSGNYSDLAGQPNFRNDSLPVWNSFIDYNLLKNKPNLSADGSFSGSYNDLSDKPNIENIATNAAYTVVGNWSYGSLKNLPVFPDSIAFYSNRVDYRKVSNLPNMKDTVEKYAVNTGGTSDYNYLENKPNFADSVSRYAFSGNYYELSNRPNIKDTISEYGFSGNYEDLEGRPIGDKHGQILYWNNNSKEWTKIEPGSAGYLLVANSEGVPQWTNPAYVMKNIANTKFVKVMVNNFPLAHATVQDDMGLMHNGELEVPAFEDVNISVITDDGYGVKDIAVNEVSNFYADKGNGYTSFSVSDTDTVFTIDITLESDTLLIYNQYFYPRENASDSVDTVIDTVLVGYGKSLTYDLQLLTGFGFSEYEVSGNGNFESITEGIRSITINKVTGNEVITLKYRQGLFSVGDLYYENGALKGVVFEVLSGGEQAKVISLSSLNSTYTSQWNNSSNLYTRWGTIDASDGSNNINNAGSNPIFIRAASYGTGWYLPAINELNSFYNALPFIKTILESQGVDVNSLNIVWSSTEEVNSPEFAYLFDFNIGAKFSIDKAVYGKVFAIKKVVK